MAKKFKNIVLTKKRTRVEFSGDNWLIDLRYLVNGKTTYECQIIRPDLQTRIKSLKNEGFKLLQDQNN